MSSETVKGSPNHEFDVCRAALEDFKEFFRDHYGSESYDAECSDSCISLTDEEGDKECKEHRPDIKDDWCDAHPEIDERDMVCMRCTAIRALEAYKELK